MTPDQILQNYFSALRRIRTYDRNVLREKVRTFKINIKLNSSNVVLSNALINFTYNTALRLLRNKRKPVEISYPIVNVTDREIIEILEQIQPATVEINQHGLKTARLQQNITKQYISDLFGNQPNHKFSWFVLDKDGNLQRVTPQNATYSPSNVVKHYHGVLAKYYDITHKYLQVYPADSHPQDFKLFDGKVNCVLSAISRQVPKLAKNIRKYAKDNNFIENNRPATKADLDSFHKKFRVRIVVHSQTGIWYKSNPNDKSEKRKEIHIFAHDEHASIFIPIKPITSVNISTNLSHDLRSLHQPIKQNIKFSCINGQEFKELKSFRAGSTIYKTYQPPSDSKDYYHCDSELSYEFTKWKLDNNIRPLEEPYYSIMKASNHHLTTQQFQTIEDREYHNYDQNKAFPSFRNNKYYAQYQLFAGFVNLYKNTDKSHINKPGVSRIENVVFNNEIIEKIQWIQSGCFYTHIRLNFILENNLATFDITDTVVAKSEDLQFPFKPFDADPENKRFNNSFIGRLIAGGHDNTVTGYYSTTSDQEMQQMKYELEQLPETITVIPEGDLLVHTYTSDANRALFHIHSQIIDYQQVALMEEMCKVPINELVAFFTDGFFTTTEQLIANSSKPHEFKYKFEKIRGQSTFMPAIHQQLPIQVAPPIEQHLNRLNGFSATTGPAGCGKTYISVEKYPRIHRIILGPNHKIVSDHSRFGTAQTYHKFFGIGVNYHTQQFYEQIDLDEITEVSDEHLQIITNICKKHRMNLTVFGDFAIKNNELKIYQRPPPSPSGKPILIATLRDFVVTEEISAIRRQSNPADSAFLDSLRELTPQQQLAALKKKVNTVAFKYEPNICGISARHTRCSMFNQLSRDAQEELYIYADTPIFEHLHPARVVTKSKTEIKGSILQKCINEIWFDRQSADVTRPKHLKYEAAYFRTADNIQGESISTPIYIDTEYLDEGFLYTAVTRCRSLDQIHLIN